MFHRRKLLPLYIAATLASGQAAAVGLGDLSLHSHLGKPLQAEVALSHMGDLSLDQLKVQIATEAEYSALGVEYSYQHTRLRIEPFTKNGQTYVRITSSEPISEPYLNFVLNLRWPQGQVMREFTVLLDPVPAGSSALASQPDAAEPLSVAGSAAAEPASAAPAEAARPVPVAAAEPVRRVARQQAAARPAVQPGVGSYMTQRGDSLWRLAAKLRPSESVPVEQMMAALLSANPQAFIDGNAARLREAVAIDVAAAARIALQGGAAPAANTSTAVADAGATTTQPSQAPLPVAAAPSTSAQGGLVQENAALKAQVADLSQNVSTLNTSLAESTDRLRAMEARLDSVLQQFQEQRAAQASTFEERAQAPVAMPGSVINQVNAAELRPPPKAHTPWWVHLLYWSGIGAAVGWAVREHFWPARRLALAGIDDDTAHVPAQPAAPAFREVQRPAAASAQQDWEVPADDQVLSLDLGDIVLPADHEPASIELELPRQPQDQVDASISAGVFVAFGRFDEAERLLREALAQDPARDDLRLQLLDVYLQSDQPQAFEQLARTIEAGPASAETLAELAVLRDSYQSRG